jgi:hypothetical protein
MALASGALFFGGTLPASSDTVSASGPRLRPRLSPSKFEMSGDDSGRNVLIPVLNQGDQGENLIPPSLILIPDSES